jgi:hypothetical protein
MKTVYKVMFWVCVIMYCYWMIKGDGNKIMVFSAFIWIAKLGKDLEEMKEKVYKPMPKKTENDMKIKFCAMTLQTADHLPPPKEVFGIPAMTNKGSWFMEYYERLTCTKTNSFYKEGEMYFSKGTYRINENTLKVSINNGDWEDFEIQNYIIWTQRQ